MQVFDLPQLHWFRPSKLKIWFPESWKVSFCPMEGYAKERIGTKEIQARLADPTGTKSISKLAEGKEEAVIVFDDMSRPTRADEIIPFVLKELRKGGISSDHVRLICGLGAHGACNRSDFAKKLGEDIVQEYPAYNHNPFGNLTEIGITKRETPVSINSEYMSCDMKVAIGCVLPHPTAGFGGGAKLIMPGISSFQSAYHLHGILEGRKPGERQNPTSGWGRVENNEVRADMEEASRMAGLDIKVDVMTNGTGDTTDVFAGDFILEHREAVREGRRHYSTAFPREVDVIVANTYAKANEAVIGLSPWAPKLNENGVMVLIAEAPEGQITHYLLGKFGMKGGSPLTRRPHKPHYKKLIVYSSYKVADPLFPIAEKDSIVWVKTWREVLEEVKSVFPTPPRVALLPNAEIQLDEETINQP